MTAQRPGARVPGRGARPRWRRRRRTRSSSRRWPRAVTGASEKEEQLIATALGRAADAAGRRRWRRCCARSRPGRGRPGARGADPGRARRRRGGGGAAGGRRRRTAGAARRDCAGRRAARQRVRAEAVLAAFRGGAQDSDAPTACDAPGPPTWRASCRRRSSARPSTAPTPSRPCAACWAPTARSSCAARAIVALGALGASEGAARRRWPSPQAVSDDPVLRYLATRELGDLEERRPGAPIRGPCCARRSTIRIPRVRETAALGLEKQGDVTAGGALITGAKQEPWPFVRRAELEALGRLCVAGGGDLDDPRHRARRRRGSPRGAHRPRRAARTRAPATVFLHTLKQHDENASLRALSAGLLGRIGRQRGRAARWPRRCTAIVSESEADLALEGVVVAVLRALAHLGGPDAVNAAVTLAGDRRHPFRADGGRGARDALRSRRGQRGAAASLGAAGDPCWRAPPSAPRSAAPSRPASRSRLRGSGRASLRRPPSAALRSTFLGSISRPRSNMLRALGISLARTCMRPSIR